MVIPARRDGLAAGTGAGWLPAWHCTVIGAAHRRKGVVCQDFSAVHQLRSPSGESLQLLVVADGHGGERYRYSDAGSRLACQEAAAAVSAALQSTPLDQTRAWQQLLQEGFPATIQTRWLEAIQRHWQQQHQQGLDHEPFCPTLYGSTLGLLLLSPAWWGCTGLGDWDLVRVSSGDNRLLSEETVSLGSGEATASLCLSKATARWAARAQLEPLAGSSTPFALVLSTDGIRKSCATDGDFLELCSQVVEINDSDQLVAGLAEISAAGSGDDLSIAVASWSPSAQQASDRQVTLLVPEISNGIHGRRRVAPILTLAATGAAAIAAAAWLLRPQGWSGASPQQAPPPPFNPLPAIQREAERLCRDPGLIAGTLSQRSQQFSQLRSMPSHGHQLLAMADQDPLGALIAWSQPPLPPPAEAETWQGDIPPARREEPHPVPGRCPALDQALAAQWHTQARPAPPLAVPAPAPLP